MDIIEEDIYEYGGRYMTKSQLCWAMSTCSGTWTATKVGTFSRLPEPEFVSHLEYDSCLKNYLYD